MSILRPVIARLQSFRDRPVVAAVLVSAITLVLVGGVVLSTTSLGCGPANRLGIKGLSHCKTTSNLIALNPSPGPTPTAVPTDNSPYSPPATPPYSPPASPPNNPPTGPIPPTTGPASGAYPPFAAPASGPGGGSIPSLALSCRLPVYVGPPGSGGFITNPGGTFIADPTSAVTLPPGQQPSPSPNGYGYGYGPAYIGMTYDGAFKRWLPVPHTWVSPDGAHYAHASPDSIYIEDVVAGTSIEVGQGQAWAVVGVWPQGVYATVVNQAGLWLFPYSGPGKQIATTGFWQIASGTAAYGTATSAVPQGIENTIIRLDLKSGVITNWFTRKGAQGFAVALDAQGYPVIQATYFVQANQGATEMWDATSATSAIPIFGTTVGMYPTGPPLADGHGIWFPMSYNVPNGPGSTGLALYVPGSGLYWMSSLTVQLAGGCS